MALFWKKYAILQNYCRVVEKIGLWRIRVDRLFFWHSLTLLRVGRSDFVKVKRGIAQTIQDYASLAQIEYD